MKKSDSKDKFNEINLEDHFKEPEKDPQDGIVYSENPENAMIEDHFKEPKKDPQDGIVYSENPENAMIEDYVDNSNQSQQQGQNLNDDNVSYHSGNTIETEYFAASDISSIDNNASTRASTTSFIDSIDSSEVDDKMSKISDGKSDSKKNSFLDKINDSRSNNSEDKGSGRF